jgi:hypothetical protein
VRRVDAQLASRGRVAVLVFLITVEGQSKVALALGELPTDGGATVGLVVEGDAREGHVGRERIDRGGDVVNLTGARGDREVETELVLVLFLVLEEGFRRDRGILRERHGAEQGNRCRHAENRQNPAPVHHRSLPLLPLRRAVDAPVPDPFRHQKTPYIGGTVASSQETPPYPHPEAPVAAVSVQTGPPRIAGEAIRLPGRR